MSKKVSVILIFLIIIISLGISIYIPNIDKIESEDLSINYSTIQVDGKIGVINQENDKIIEPQYEKIIIVNPHRAVFFCYSENEQKVLNDKNEKAFKKYENVFPIETSYEKYDKDTLIYEENGKFGLLTITGKEITNAKYEEIITLGAKEEDLLAKQNGKYGILNLQGKSKIACKYDEISTDGYYTEENGYQKSGYIVKTTTDEGYRYGYYDSQGIQVLEEEYNEIARITEIKSDNIYLMVAKNGQCGIFVNNTKIINTEYQSINYNSDMQIFLVERTKKFGAVNLKGAKILEPEYSELKIKGIYIYSTKDDVKKVFDEQGNEVNIPFETTITATSNSKYFIRNDVGNYSIVNSKLEKLTTQNYKFIEYAYDTYFIVTNEQNKMGIIDLDENIKIEFNYDLIQLIKGKNIIQAIDFATNKTDIYDNKFDLTLEMTNANVELLDNKGIKIYNNEQENILDDNGKIITE